MLGGWAAVLTQHDDDGREFVVAYASRSNNTAESKYGFVRGRVLGCSMGGCSLPMLLVWYSLHAGHGSSAIEMVDGF